MNLPPIDCNGCRKCCQGDTIELTPEDDPSLYKTRLQGGRRVLAKGPTGNCIYLGPKGCKIQDTKPKQCRIFDCRLYALVRTGHPGLSEQQRRVVIEGQRRLQSIRELA